MFFLVHRVPYKHSMCGFFFESFLVFRSPGSIRRPCSLLNGAGNQPDCVLNYISLFQCFIFISFISQSQPEQAL